MSFVAGLTIIPLPVFTDYYLMTLILLTASSNGLISLHWGVRWETSVDELPSLLSNKDVTSGLWRCRLIRVWFHFITPDCPDGCDCLSVSGFIYWRNVHLFNAAATNTPERLFPCTSGASIPSLSALTLSLHASLSAVAGTSGDTSTPPRPHTSINTVVARCCRAAEGETSSHFTDFTSVWTTEY